MKQYGRAKLALVECKSRICCFLVQVILTMSGSNLSTLSRPRASRTVTAFIGFFGGESALALPVQRQRLDRVSPIDRGQGQ